MTILFAATAAFVGMLAFNRLPQHYHALFKSRRFRMVTTNRFCISVEARDPCFDRVETKALLESLGGSSVEEIEE